MQYYVFVVVVIKISFFLREGEYIFFLYFVTNTVLLKISIVCVRFTWYIINKLYKKV